jgi:beta-glucosidase
MRSNKGLVLTLIALAVIIFFSSSGTVRSQAASDQPAYRKPQLPIEQRVADLLSRMTLEEKGAQTRCLLQLGQVLRDQQGNFSPAKAQEFVKDGIGQLGTIAPPPGMKHPADAARFANDVQRFLMEKTRLGIPVIFHGEGLHGLWAPDATSFPQAIALASTWDVDLFREVFTVTAAEARARGTHQLLTPVIDVARDPRWGRTEESYGEDPHLVSRLGVACIKAFQGPGPGIDKQHVIATTKHFAGYGSSEGGRNIAPANYSERIYREFILPPFKAAIMEARALSVMPSYNEIDGIPSHANKWLLQKVLREEWGFRGVVVSDYGGIERLVNPHHVAANLEEAAKRALEAAVLSIAGHVSRKIMEHYSHIRMEAKRKAIKGLTPVAAVDSEAAAAAGSPRVN